MVDLEWLQYWWYELGAIFPKVSWIYCVNEENGCEIGFIALLLWDGDYVAKLKKTELDLGV